MSSLNICALMLLFIVRIVNAEIINDYNELSFDENENLVSHWILHNGGHCGTTLEEIWIHENYQGRKLVQMSEKFFNVNLKATLSKDKCVLICVDRGTPKSYIRHIPSYKLYWSESFNTTKEDIEKWVRESCQTAQVGIESLHYNSIHIYRYNADMDDGPDWEYMYDVQREEAVYWQNTTLGDVLMATDNTTHDMISLHTVKYDSMWTIGVDMEYYVYNESTDDIFETLEMHYNWSIETNYTFSELGFKKDRLPDEVFGGMQTYLYNNRNGFNRQDYGGPFELYNNDPDLLKVPEYLQAIWGEKLKRGLEDWIGGNSRLVRRPWHGIRQYEDGFRFKFHTDQLYIGIICNWAQRGMRTPWPLELFDHAYRLHAVDLAPGELIYFESARVLHGRSGRLEGDSVNNIMVHFTFEAEPDWASRNPNSAFDKVPPHCWESFEFESASEDCDARLYPDTLSSVNLRATSTEDIFDYWMQRGDTPL